MTNDDRLNLLNELAGMVELDFPDCDGTGSVFCPACTAHRAINALYDVYEDVVSDGGEDLLTYDGVPPGLDSDVPVEDLDEIAERIIKRRKDNGDESDPIYSDNLILN